MKQYLYPANILIPKGTDEIIVEGKTKLAPSEGNPFIFNA